jgi:hypothetical protein
MTQEPSKIAQIVDLFAREGDRLAEPVPMDGMPSMTFTCEISHEKLTSEDEFAIKSCNCPNEMKEFWGITRTATLFEDKEYGQWGLEILAPQDAAKKTLFCQSSRPREFIAGDLVIGKFLGDSDLLIIRCDDSTDDFGHIIVALPIDPRSDWDRVAHSLSDFLEMFARAGGVKFWSRRQ